MIDLLSSTTETKELFIPFYNTEIIPLEEVISNNIEIRKNLQDNYRITLRNKLQYNKLKNLYEHVLDFDVYNNSEVGIHEYKDIFSELRRFEKKEFLKFVTEKFMSKMEFLT